MVPRTVLTRSGHISLNAARPVNIVQPRTAVNNAGPMKNVIDNAYSIARRTFNKITAANNSNFNKRVNTFNDKNVNFARPNTVVNTARPKAVLSVIKGNKRNVVKASACWVWRPKHKVLDHVSRNNGASKSFKRFDYVYEKVLSTEEPRVNQETDASINSTNTINTVSPTINNAGIEYNVVDENIVHGCDDDPNMPELEEIVY
ncbi:hypothetical protein Tco_0606299 [Tanacetum coccineum]